MSEDDVDFYNPGKPGSENSGPPNSGNRESDNSGRRTSNPSREMAWNAPEFMELHRGAGWYAGLATFTVVIAAAIYFLSKDYFAIVSIVILGVIVGIFVSRKPHNTSYRLSDSGLEIGNKKYNYSLFKSFTIIREGQLSSVEFIPLKRFNLPVSALFDVAAEQQVVEIIGEHLPYAQHKPGFVDRLSQRLRL